MPNKQREKFCPGLSTYGYKHSKYSNKSMYMSNGYYPLSHKRTPIKEVTSNKRENLYGQIALQELHHDNKSPKNG